MEEKKRGGKREGAGRKSVPFKKRSYRIPKEYLEQASTEIKEILIKYRAQCKRN